MREYLQERGVSQEFIHVATPEENCFIEAYHSIMQRELLDPRQFDSIEHSQQVMQRWQQFYNHRRRHDSLDGSRPATVWQAYGQQQPGEALQPKGSDEALCTGRLPEILSNWREPPCA